MQRKLVKQGAATMMVSLPAKWIKKFNLQKGDEIDVEESDSSLIITKETKAIKKETQINITKTTESSIRTLITNAYRLGYDKVKVFFRNEAQFKILNETIRTYLIGFDVVRKEKDNCVIENITEPSEEQFDVLLQKIFYNISLVISETAERLTNQEKQTNYQDFSIKVKQYDNFCRRVLSKSGCSEKTPLFWAFLTLMVHGEREIHHFNKYLDAHKIKDAKEILSMMAGLKKAFELLKEGYFKKDIKYLEELHELEKSSVYKKAYPLLSAGKNSIPVYHIAGSIRSFYLASSPLMGLII